MVENARTGQDVGLAVGLPQIQVVADGQAEFIDVRDFLQEGQDLGTMADADVIARAAELTGMDLDRNFKVTRPATGNILISRIAEFG